MIYYPSATTEYITLWRLHRNNCCFVGLFSPLPNDMNTIAFSCKYLLFEVYVLCSQWIGKRAPLPLCEGWRRCGKRQIGRLNTKVRKRLNLTWEFVGSLDKT